MPPPLPPPPLPATANGQFFRVLAQASWATIIVSVVIHAVTLQSSVNPHSRAEALGQGLASAFIAITGVVCGIIALCGIPKYGRKGLLWPALTGIGLWLLLFAISIPTFLLVRQKAQQRHAALAKKVALVPLVHIPGAARVQDSSLGVSFDLPPGYTAFPPESKPKEYRLAFVHRGNDGSVSLILVKSMHGTIVPNDHLTSQYLPAGKNLTLTSFSWRGLEVDGVRVPENVGTGDFVTLNVQIPLKKDAIQIGFGGPAAREASVRALADQVLSTMDGEVNW